jgi:Tfp pilus assembly protein PilN
MSDEINLLYTKKQGKYVRASAKIRLYRFIALGLLSLAGFASVVAFLLVLASPLPGLKQQEKALLADLSASDGKILKLSLVAQRLSEITTIMNKRTKADSTMELFRKDVPATATLSSFTLNQKVVTLTLSTQDLDDIETYSRALVALTKEKKIVSSVVLTGVSVGGNQPFEANYTITLL